MFIRNSLSSRIIAHLTHLVDRLAEPLHGLCIVQRHTRTLNVDKWRIKLRVRIALFRQSPELFISRGVIGPVISRFTVIETGISKSCEAGRYGDRGGNLAAFILSPRMGVTKGLVAVWSAGALLRPHAFKRDNYIDDFATGFHTTK
jgi:hypothetical protein